MQDEPDYNSPETFDSDNDNSPKDPSNDNPAQDEPNKTDEPNNSDNSNEPNNSESPNDSDKSDSSDPVQKSDQTPEIINFTQKSARPRSRSSKTYTYKNRPFYAFRYVAMLLSGAGFISSLISIFSVVISKLVDKDFYVSSWLGPIYASRITTVIILGLTHLLLSLTFGKNWEASDGEKRKYPAVLSVIYTVGLGTALISFLIAFVSLALGSVLGLNDATGTEILEQFLISLVAIFILGLALVQPTKIIYITIMSCATVVAVILFLVFPATEIRNATYDSNLTSDLYSISNSIENYVAENNSLPNSLSDLSLKDELHHKLDTYEYTPSITSSSRYTDSVSYQLCAEFKTDTTSSEDFTYTTYSSFSSHDKGRECFTKTAHTSSSSTNSYSYYKDGYDSYDE